jgi:inosine/xanthosine triphosphate pyrophosphatase family protein
MMIVQGVTKKRCMDIDQESGEVHYVPKETKEQQERNAISKLNLWKNVYKKPPSFIAEDSTVSLYKMDSEKGRYTHLYIYACMYTYIYLYIYIYVYIFTHIHIDL